MDKKKKNFEFVEIGGDGDRFKLKSYKKDKPKRRSGQVRQNKTRADSAKQPVVTFVYPLGDDLNPERAITFFGESSATTQNPDDPAGFWAEAVEQPRNPESVPDLQLNARARERRPCRPIKNVDRSFDETDRPVSPEFEDSSSLAELDGGWFDVIDTSHGEFDQKDLYSIELQRLNAVLPLDNCYQEFAVPGFNPEWKTVSKNKYFVIQRKSVRLNIDSAYEHRWVYGCSCSPSNQRFVSSLHSSLLCTEQDLNIVVNTCFHVDVVSKILEQFDLRNGIIQSPDLEVDESMEKLDIVAFPHDSTKVCVRAGGIIGFVGIEMGKLRCMTCTYDSRNCCHILHLRNAKESSSDSIPDEAFDLIAREGQPWLPSSFNIQKPVSMSSIPFKLTPELSRIISSSYGGLCVNELHPNVTSCLRCKCVLDKGSIKENVRFFTRATIVQCSVHSKICLQCQEIYEYDGNDDGIVNMGSFLIGYDVLRDYMYHFVYSNSCTLHGYYDVWRLQQADLGNANMLTYQNWRGSWYAFLSLLDINFDEWITCPVCGSSPEVVVCDGTSLGFRKQLLLMTSDRRIDQEVVERKSTFKDRLAIPDNVTRGLLQKWSQALKYAKLANFPTKDEENLLKLLETKYPCVFSVFQWSKDNFSDKSYRSIAEFLLCLSSGSPVCSYIPPSDLCQNLMHSLCTEDITSLPSLLASLHEEIPIIFDMLTSLSLTRFPAPWRNLFSWLYDISSKTFLADRTVLGPEVTLADDPLSFFPTLSKCRERGSYQIDFQHQMRKDEDPCTKKSKGHPSLTPGIFTIYCPHGINYGFQAMESHESPNVPFTIFRTRFSKAPETIIYDNCCNLHSYCLNRDPVFFKKTKFVIDRFHWKNHTGCCVAYNISTYPQFRSINSQVNEQQNSTIKRLRSQLSYMGPDNFMIHCKFFLWFRNFTTIDRIIGNL